MTHRSSKVSCNTLDDSKVLVKWKSIVERDEGWVPRGERKNTLYT